MLSSVRLPHQNEVIKISNKSLSFTNDKVDVIK